MRRLLILLALTALMFGLQFYEVATDGSIEPKTLAAFGFVLLAAYVIGEFAALVKLPRVTGYLVTGVLFGPYLPAFVAPWIPGINDWFDERLGLWGFRGFFSETVVGDLRLINDLAVGLIALTAGGELQVGQLKKDIRAIMIIIGVQVLIVLPLVMGTIIIGGSQIVTWPGGIEPSPLFLTALGLMVGALAVGNSPAVSVAIVNETESKGPFTRMNLGVTITKDLVVVLIFSIMTAIGVSMIHSAFASEGADDPAPAAAEEDSDTVAEGPAVCGDGARQEGEACDDGNTAAGDGCDASCGLEAGFFCPQPGSACQQTVCGDGELQGLEACDDGNTTAGDGCDPECQKEPPPSFGETMLLLGQELFFSLIAGAILGFILIGWLLRVNTENMIFLVGLVFLGMYVGHTLHLERILVFIVAGFIVENWPGSHVGHDMIHTIERVSPPVYVVFFAVAGAGLDLNIIASFFVIALLVVLVRIAAMLVATRIGTQLSKLGTVFKKKLGIGFFSQAGVTLGLTLIASEKLNSIDVGPIALGSDVFTPIVLGIVAINLIVGPVFLKMSLSASGETKEARGGDDGDDDVGGGGPTHEGGGGGHAAAAPADEAGTPHGPTASPSEVVRSRDLQRPEIAMPERLPQVEFPTAEVDPALDTHLASIRSQLVEAAASFHWNFTAVRRNDARAAITELRALASDTMRSLLGRLEKLEDPEDQRQWVRQARVNLAEAFYERLASERGRQLEDDDAHRTFDELVMRVGELTESLDLPRTIAVAEHEDLFAPVELDGRYLALRKRLSRLRRKLTRSRPRRLVPVRQLFEFFVRGPLPQRLVNLANVAGYQHFFFWRKLAVATRYVDAAICEILRDLGDPLLIEPRHLRGQDEEEEADEATESTDAAAIHDGEETTSRTAASMRETAIEVRGRVEDLASNIDREFESILTDVTIYADGMHRRLRSVLATAFEQMVEGARQAGTYLLPVRQINTSRIYDENRKGREEIETALLRWHVANIGYSGRLLAVLDIIDLQHVAFARVLEAEITFANALLNDLKPYPQRVAQSLETALTEIHATLDGDDFVPRRALATLEALRDRLGEEITTRATRRLEALHDHKEFSKLLQPFASQLAEDCMQLTHTVEVVESDSDDLAPGITPDEPVLKTLQLRELAHELLVGEALVKLKDVNDIVQDTVERTISDLADAHRVVGFNLDAAINELATYLESPEASENLELAREFAEGGLRRSRSRIDETLAAIDAATQEIAAKLNYEIFHQLRRLRRMATDGDVGQIRNYLAQRTFEERRARAARGVRGVWQRTSQQLRDTYERRVAPVVHWAHDQLRQRLGIEELPDEALVDLTDQATFAATSNDSIPATYRRLFTPGPVEISEFFVGRGDDVERLDAAWKRFQRGRSTSVLVTGESGIGKTSFINQAVRRLDSDLPVERMTFSHNFQTERQLAIQLGDLLGHRSRDLNRLRARLRNTKRQRIIIIEGLHNFYLRTLDGLAALQKFILLVSETSSTFFWIASTDSDAAAWFSNLVPVDLFTDTIELRRMDAESLHRMIEARHNVSGYELRFLGTSWLDELPSGLGQPRPEQREAAFFEALARESGGNPRLALYHWLRALHGLERDVVEVDPVRPLQMQFVEQLRTRKLVALATLVSHGGLTMGEFETVYRCTRDEAQALLTSLVQINLLYLDRETYRLNPVLHPYVADVLRERHIL